MSAIQSALFTAGGGGNDAFTKLLLHCEGADASTTFTDSSSVGNTMTAVGNAQIDTAQFKFTSASLLSDGTGDRVTTPNSANWNFGATGSGDFTVDFWVRFNSVAASSAFVCADDAGGTNGWEIWWVQSTTKLRVQKLGTGAATSDLTWNPTTSTWYHVAIVRSSSTLTGYVDGTSLGTFTDISFNNDSNGLTLAAFGGGGGCLNGWMDEIRISKGVARWTANFTPPAVPYF